MICRTGGSVCGWARRRSLAGRGRAGCLNRGDFARGLAQSWHVPVCLGPDAVRVSWAAAGRCRLGQVGDIGGGQAICAPRGTRGAVCRRSGTPGWNGSPYRCFNDGIGIWAVALVMGQDQAGFPWALVLPRGRPVPHLAVPGPGGKARRCHSGGGARAGDRELRFDVPVGETVILRRACNPLPGPGNG